MSGDDDARIQLGERLERKRALVQPRMGKFKPWLVKSDRLFKAVDTSDGDKKRGLLRIE